jgi:hypothetical protein
MSDQDEFEELFARGVTDGLPVVPPTPERVARAIAAAGRPADELIAEVPPGYGRATVERIAVNAVMAGCRPEYLPVVIAGVEAMCDDAFDLHGLGGTTDAVAPLFIINGPVRRTLDVNCGVGVFGPGWRANATIGRALRLVWANLGGARAGGISMSTFSQPGRYSYCIGEWEEESPWAPLHVERGFAPEESTIAAFAAEPPLIVIAARSRTAEEVLATVARSMESIGHHKLTGLGDTLLVLAPEHARVVADDGWTKTRVREFLWRRLQKRVMDLVPGQDGAEGLAENALAAYPDAQRNETAVPKFRAPENLILMVAGGTAGRFTAVVPGWSFPGAPTRLVIKKIR